MPIAFSAAMAALTWPFSSAGADRCCKKQDVTTRGNPDEMDDAELVLKCRHGQKPYLGNTIISA
jgi:hypothetical protein